jgi:hypothetical protein
MITKLLLVSPESFSSMWLNSSCAHLGTSSLGSIAGLPRGWLTCHLEDCPDQITKDDAGPGSRGTWTQLQRCMKTMNRFITVATWGFVTVTRTGKWICGELHEDEMGGACSMGGKNCKYIQNFSRKTWRKKRPLVRPRSRWEGNIKMYLKEIRYEDVDWIHLAQDRDQCRALGNTVMNLRVP